MTIYNLNSIFHQLDLSSLKHFYAVSTFGGFSKASRATGMSQPALSLGLKKLEKTLGVQLIDRKSRNFTLTQPGLELLSFCQRLEGTLESMVGNLGIESVSVRKRLRLGTALSIGFMPFLPFCAKEAKSDRPYELELSSKNTYFLLKEVADGSLDAAIVPDDVYEGGLRFTRILEDQIVFVVGKGLLRRKFEEMPLVTYPRDTPMRSTVDKLCHQKGLKFKTLFSTNSVDALKLLVENDAGGAFVLKSLVRNELSDGKLNEVKIPFSLPKAGLMVATRDDEQGGAISKIVVKQIRNL